MTSNPNATSDSPVIQLRIPRPQREAMIRAAEALDINRSELMRQGIAYMIEKVETENR